MTKRGIFFVLYISKLSNEPFCIRLKKYDYTASEKVNKYRQKIFVVNKSFVDKKAYTKSC